MANGDPSVPEEPADVPEGLDGVVVTTTELCEIDGERGRLSIRGFPLDEIASHATFEELLYLLWFDELPTTAELTDFRRRLAAARSLPGPTLDLLRDLAAESIPVIDALGMAMATAGLDLPEWGDDDLSDAAREEIVATVRLASIVAAYWRLSNGDEPIEPRADLSHVENYWYTLTGERPETATRDALETYLNVATEHGLNASSFVARTIVSTDSDVVSAVAGAVGAFKGARHGGAPGLVVGTLEEAREFGDVDAYLRETLDAGRRLPGFGHRVYEVHDPRAVVLAEPVERFYEADDDRAFHEFALEFERAARGALDERYPHANLCTNIEFYAALLFRGLSLDPALFTPTFAVARVAGWTAHCREQRQSTRIIRPRAAYAGERNRTWVPIERR